MMKCFLKVKAVIVSIIMLMLCVPTGGCAKDDGSLNILLMVNPEQDAFYKQYFGELETEMGIDITYMGYAWQDYYQQLKTAMQDVAPDIFYLRPGDIKKLYKEGQIADLKSYLNSEAFTAENDMSKLFDNISDPYRFDGTNVGSTAESAGIYGINLGFSYQGMGYNKKLVRAREAVIKATNVNGESLVMPWELAEGESYTFEEFVKLLEICTTETGGGIDGKDRVVGMNVPKDQFMSMAWAFGGEIVSSDNTTITVNTPQFKNTLDFIKTGIDKKYISKEHTWGEWSVDKVAFFSEVASWEVEGYQNMEGFEYDMMPWPTVDGGANWIGQIGTSALAVSAQSDSMDTALKVAGTFYSEAVLDRMLKRGLILPMVKEVAENGYLTDDETYKPEHRKIFIDVISGKNGKFSPINNTFSSEWFDKLIVNLDEVWNGTTSVADYLRIKQGEMQTLFDRQKS